MERKLKEINELNGKIAQLEESITRDTEFRDDAYKNRDREIANNLIIGINKKRDTVNLYLTKLLEVEQELKLLEGNKILKEEFINLIIFSFIIFFS